MMEAAKVAPMNALAVAAKSAKPAGVKPQIASGARYAELKAKLAARPPR